MFVTFQEKAVYENCTKRKSCEQMLDFVGWETWPQMLLELKRGRWGLNANLIKAKEEHYPQMAVVSQTLLKQDELFRRELELLPQRDAWNNRNYSSFTIHLSRSAAILFFTSDVSEQLGKQVLQCPCVQKRHSQITCLGRDNIWFNVWCPYSTVYRRV